MLFYYINSSPFLHEKSQGFYLTSRDGEDGTRTHTLSPTQDFKSCASTIPPLPQEVPAGVGPALAELQSAALPLG